MIADKMKELVSDALAGDPASVVALLCFGLLYLIVTVALLKQLWAREGGTSKKVYWSLVLMLPVLGWMFYLAFYKLPPSQHFR